MGEARNLDKRPTHRTQKIVLRDPLSLEGNPAQQKKSQSNTCQGAEHRSNFCLACLGALWPHRGAGGAGGPGGTARCPLCQEPFPDGLQLRKNRVGGPGGKGVQGFAGPEVRPMASNAVGGKADLWFLQGWAGAGDTGTDFGYNK